MASQSVRESERNVEAPNTEAMRGERGEGEGALTFNEIFNKIIIVMKDVILIYLILSKYTLYTMCLSV